MFIPDGGNSLTIYAFILIHYQSVTDRQMDRQTVWYDIAEFNVPLDTV